MRVYLAFVQVDDAGQANPICISTTYANTKLGEHDLTSTQCLYPNCNHVNDDEGITDLCGCHAEDLMNAITRKKKDNPDFFRGEGPRRICEHLTRIEILQLLNVDDRTIRDVVSKVKPPCDFVMTWIGQYEDEKEKLTMKFKQFKSEYYNGVSPREKALCSVFFIHSSRNGVEMSMFRTASKHVAGDLENKMMVSIIPRLKEIIYAQQGYPFDEWHRHVSYEGHYYHYV